MVIMRPRLTLISRVQERAEAATLEELHGMFMRAQRRYDESGAGVARSARNMIRAEMDRRGFRP